jgi:hypothetical protein
MMACIGYRGAVADRVVDIQADKTRPIAKTWVNDLSVWCDTIRAPARRSPSLAAKTTTVR